MKLFITFLFTLITAAGFTQAIILDKISAKVGNEIVLHSEVEERVKLWKDRSESLPENANCTILEELMVTNLLVHHARIDSLEVADEEVERQLDSRINDILAMMGNDVQQFEEYYGMTVTQAKELNRIDLRKKLNAEKMQSMIIEGIEVTPAEVIEYFEQIPRDSLPFFNSEVQIAEIVHKPEVNDTQRNIALEKITMIADSLKNGGVFEDLARRFSDDRGSAQQGGRLGRSPRGSFVQEFEAAAYQLEEGEISDIVETEFGFHIIRLEARYGNVIDVSHILVTPEITEYDLERAREHLKTVREGVLTDFITWVDAVKEYSNPDVQSYSNGGRVVNPNTGNTFFETGELDPDIFFAIDTIEVGGITNPIAFRSPRGEVIYKIIRLQSRTSPHQASLQRDYAKIREAAKQSKRNEAFNEWIEERIDKTFILVDDYYASCPNISRWRPNTIRS